jgi:hypothetical protein
MEFLKKKRKGQSNLTDVAILNWNAYTFNADEVKWKGHWTGQISECETPENHRKQLLMVSKAIIFFLPQKKVSLKIWARLIA